ncbi:MMPL family transporter [Paractinoplanes lichenicola]|uniref:MMPL family transporter n=1 Tax=Paractinoplanes lichenicola TaxID=2802976 RepID=A0ABS1VH52_9ACTN|nr:MMPL family transporter [Actinoplanes lichenicola]MBL7253620.1 MMPL family transporter [Actinoplanes lichenicola]
MAIDYALLIVTRWREELGRGADPAEAVHRSMATAGRSVFGLSMDYEVFLLSRIREEHDNGHATDAATVHGLARTGRLVTSAALILFLAFISLVQVPTTEVKMLATALALGIVIDATIVRGVLAPALVAALGRANWWTLRRRPGQPLSAPAAASRTK